MNKFWFLLLPLLAAPAFADEWLDISGKQRMDALNDIVKRRPMNFGEGKAGINYGGALPNVEGEEKDNEKPPEKKPDYAKAAPSAGNCLGICQYRKTIVSDVIGSKAIKPPTRNDIKKIQEEEGTKEYEKVSKWMQANKETDYDAVLAKHKATQAELVEYAKKNPGSWIGLKSATLHHAVQVFYMNGVVSIADPNVPIPMYGEYNKQGKFEWKTIRGKLGAEVDFAYLPADTWK